MPNKLKLNAAEVRTMMATSKDSIAQHVANIEKQIKREASLGKSLVDVTIQTDTLLEPIVKVLQDNGFVVVQKGTHHLEIKW